MKLQGAVEASGDDGDPDFLLQGVVDGREGGHGETASSSAASFDESDAAESAGGQLGAGRGRGGLREGEGGGQDSGDGKGGGEKNAWIHRFRIARISEVAGGIR